MFSKLKFSTLFLSLFVLTGCIYDDIPPYASDIEDEYENGEAISLNITLDMMGGTRGETFNEQSLQKMENYVDPSKFRVFFFDEQDQFLFESKSRWVRLQQAQDGTNYLSWKVSVPFFSYGNDTEYDWDWEIIRNKLVTESFKIALLVNRPDNEWYPGFKDLRQDDVAHWFDNTGPHWKRQNSVAYKILCDSLQKNNLTTELSRIKGKYGEPDQKNIFDIHHSQEDPIYYGKSWTNTTSTTNPCEYGAYDIIMGDYIVGQGKVPYMSSTSSWVDWDGVGPDPRFANKPTVLPSENHPIPMYGVQRYEKIDSVDWLRGTTFKLDRKIANGDKVDDSPLFLLRSVARLDLVVPSGYIVDYCNIWYPNIYARCEPMNNWDPTNLLWTDLENVPDDDHYFNDGVDVNGKPIIQTYCDEASLVKFGPLTIPGTTYNNESGTDGSPAFPNNKREFQKKLVFLYGAWFNAPTSKSFINSEGKLEYEKGWDFGLRKVMNGTYNNSGTTTHWINSYSTKEALYNDLVKPYVNVGIMPPQIHNPVTQRNTTINVSNNQMFTELDGSTHIVVYLGERNTQDPSRLFQIGSENSGYPTIMYWDIGLKTTSNGTPVRYCIPVIDYNNNYPGREVFSNPTWSGDIFTSDKYDNKLGSNGNGFEFFYKDGNQTMTSSIGWNKSGPLPIIRNHIYKLTLRSRNWSGIKGRRDIAPQFNVTSEIKRTKNVNFNVSSGKSSGKTQATQDIETIVRK